MKTVIRNKKDFYAGLMFIFFGILTIVVALDYPRGEARHMGPGYVPTLIGGLLVLFGLVTALRSLWMNSDPIKRWALRPLLLVSGAVLAFGLVVDSFGLVLSVLVLVTISCLADSEIRIYEVVVLCLVLVTIAVSTFLYAFGLPFSLWPKSWTS